MLLAILLEPDVSLGDDLVKQSHQFEASFNSFAVLQRSLPKDGDGALNLTPETKD